MQVCCHGRVCMGERFFISPWPYLYVFRLTSRGNAVVRKEYGIVLWCVFSITNSCPLFIIQKSDGRFGTVFNTLSPSILPAYRSRRITALLVQLCPVSSSQAFRPMLDLFSGHTGDGGEGVGWAQGEVHSAPAGNFQQRDCLPCRVGGDWRRCPARVFRPGTWRRVKRPSVGHHLS